MENNGRGVRKGTWSEEEDVLLRKCVEKYGEGKWNQVPLRAGLNRCRKSCRLRWLNYLRPSIKRGCFGKDELDLIIRLHKLLGNRWSLIAGRLPGRTANDIKNYFMTHIDKKPLASSHENKIVNTKNKDEDGNNKEAEEKRTITKSSIIKPKPLNFKKLNATVDKNMSIKNDKWQCNSDAAPSLHPEKIDDCFHWWSKLLKQAEDSKNDAGQTSSFSVLHVDEDRHKSFSFHEQDLWGLLDIDP